MAHTAQFTEPGWLYIDGASGFFNQDATGAHGSFVTLKSPESKDYSVIIETVQAKAPQTIGFSFTGFPKAALHLWASDFTSSNSSDWFVKQPDIVPAEGQFSLAIEPGESAWGGRMARTVAGVSGRLPDGAPSR
jgi:hypothetical protein